MIHSDNHVHTDFSTDSSTSMKSMIEQGISLNLDSICFTDHIDYDFPSEKYNIDFVFDMPTYFETIKKYSSLYPNFSIRTGVELGLKENIHPLATQLTQEYPFDFVIGSTHLVDNMDPYYSEYWESHGEANGIRHYFEVTYQNICQNFDYDVYGHIDYVIRYCPTIKKARESLQFNEPFYNNTLSNNKEIIDEILIKLIQDGKGIELNTGGLKYNLGHPNPHESILLRYHQMGGTILSIGSDAHETKHLAYDFAEAEKIIKSCGFSSYTEFSHRKPKQIML